MRLRPYTTEHQTCAGRPSEVKWRQWKKKPCALVPGPSGTPVRQSRNRLPTGWSRHQQPVRLRFGSPQWHAVGWMHLPLVSYLGDGRGLSEPPTLLGGLPQAIMPSPLHSRFNRRRYSRRLRTDFSRLEAFVPGTWCCLILRMVLEGVLDGVVEPH